MSTTDIAKQVHHISLYFVSGACVRHCKTNAHSPYNIPKVLPRCTQKNYETKHHASITPWIRQKSASMNIFPNALSRNFSLLVRLLLQFRAFAATTRIYSEHIVVFLCNKPPHLDCSKYGGYDAQLCF